VVEDVILLKCAMTIVVEIHPNLHSIYKWSLTTTMHKPLVLLCYLPLRQIMYNI